MNTFTFKNQKLVEVITSKKFKYAAIQLLKGISLAIFVVIGTFPNNDWSYSNGIDPPLLWVFNYFFENGMELGKDIIFPHGPLAFFMYPLQENILIARVVQSGLKVLVMLNFLGLIQNEKFKWLLSFFLTYFISTVVNFNHLILVNIILAYCNYYSSEIKIYKISAFILTAFAFYVKSYVAIISGVICFSFITYYILSERNFKKSLSDISIIIGLIILLWLVMYRTFSGFPRYVWGILNLAQDNSSAAAFYTFNNWFLLLLFILTLLLIAFTNNSKQAKFFISIIAVSVFAAWKHGMARTDIFHVNGFFIYIIYILFIFILFNGLNIHRNLFLSLLAIVLLNINMKHAVSYKTIKYELFRTNNFIEFVTNYQELKTSSSKKIYNQTLANKLPQNILDSINGKTVDVYPWDYSFIAVNNLNWQPRVVLHSYASYTSWLDKQNAEHFKSEKAPKFLILERTAKGNLNNGSFSSIDGRYFFNDEPNTILEIIRRYKLQFSSSKYLIFKKREKAIDIKSQIIIKNNSTWSNWIEVPETDNSLLRIKLTFNKSLIQKLKSFFFKDEQFWIYLKLNNGKIHKYRIVPKNSSDGIWINPYLFDRKKRYQVKQVMFKCSNQNILKEEIKIQWENIKFGNNHEYIDQLFNNPDFSKDSCYVYRHYTFEQKENFESNILIDDSWNGKHSLNLNPGKFSPGFTINLDSIDYGNLSISTNCWIKSPGYKYSDNATLIISVDKGNDNIIWDGQTINSQLVDPKQWSHVSNYLNYLHNAANCTLKVYLWNTSDNNLIIDDFSLNVIKKGSIEIKQK